MVVKLVDVILVLLIKWLVRGILTFLVNESAGRCYFCITIKPCANDRAGKYYPHFINGNAIRCHLRITIKSH